MMNSPKLFLLSESPMPMRIAAFASFILAMHTWAHDHQVTVAPSDKSLPAAILSAPLPSDLAGKNLKLTRADGQPVPVQALAGDNPTFLFVLENIPAGQETKLTLTHTDANPDVNVDIRFVDNDAQVVIDGQVFTAYRTHGGPKPYLFPIYGPTGVSMTRSFPMEKVKGEMRDHIHHRGLWFTFDKVNDTDFWAETPTSGQSVHTEFLSHTKGPVFGSITSKVEWKKRKGGPVAHDVRTYTFYRVPGARIVDFTISMTAADGPLRFGDSKEGLFAIRVNELIKVERKDNPGTIVNSEGQRNNEAWGKRAAWCDYFGKVDGKEVGVAIFDNAANFRHPTYWHVRTYGLFAANPFGISQFTGDKTQNGAHEVPAGQSFNATYRVLFHTGDDKTGRVADWYAAYAAPPRVTVDE
jgi:hypothetical protein